MELIERDAQLAALRAAVAGASRAGGATVLVYGEAGIGKSSLVRAALGEAEEATGLRLLWGSCEALFSPRPLGPLYDVAGQLGDRVRLALGRQDDRSELFDAVFDALRTAGHPTVLVVDDLHWADAATLDLVKFLARRIASTPSLLVLAFRDDEVDEHHRLRAVLGDLPTRNLLRLPLERLSARGVDELVRRSGVQRAGLHAVTGGNPFFVTESLRSDGLAPTVREAVLLRAARLPAPVRALLDLAAMVPGRIEADLATRLQAPQPEDISAALASGLLLAEARHFAFRHELARIAVEQSLPPRKATALHARLLHALEQAGGQQVPVARLVHHAAGAGDGPAVLRLAPIAALQAAAHGAHHEAASLYATALAHGGGLAPADRAALLERRAYQCYLVEQLAEAIAAREAALAIWREAGAPVQQAHNLRWLARLHWVCGDSSGAMGLCEAAIALLDGGEAPLELAWALSYRAQLHMLAGSMALAMASGALGGLAAAGIEDAELQAHFLNNAGCATAAADPPRGRQLLEESLRLSVAGDFSEQVARAHTNLLCIAILGRDYATARQLMARATAYYAPRRLDVWTSYHEAWQCRMDFEQCRFPEADAAAVRLTGRSGTAAISRVVALSVLARLQLRRGEARGVDTLAQATAIARTTGELLRLGPVAAAHAEAAWLGVAGADLGLVRDVLARALAQRDKRAVGELGLWLQAMGEPVDGLATSAEVGAADHLAGRWDDAIAFWSRTGCAVEEALARLASGEPGHMREALGLFDAMGLASSASRSRALLRERGVAGIARGPRATTAAHPAGLTTREVEVLRLLVQGLTNVQIAAQLVRSEKTVHHHVSAILAKLEVRSRAEASAVAVAQGLVTQLDR